MAILIIKVDDIIYNVDTAHFNQCGIWFKELRLYLVSKGIAVASSYYVAGQLMSIANNSNPSFLGALYVELRKVYFNSYIPANQLNNFIVDLIIARKGDSTLAEFGIQILNSNVPS